MINPSSFFSLKVPEESLYDASKRLIDFKIHRLPIVDRTESNTILHIATHHGILSFLMERVCGGYLTML